MRVSSSTHFLHRLLLFVVDFVHHFIKPSYRYTFYCALTGASIKVGCFSLFLSLSCFSFFLTWSYSFLYLLFFVKVESWLLLLPIYSLSVHPLSDTPTPLRTQFIYIICDLGVEFQQFVFTRMHK